MNTNSTELGDKMEEIGASAGKVVIVPPARGLFSNLETNIELLNRPESGTYAPLWRLTVPHRDRIAQRIVAYERLSELGSCTGWTIRWSLLSVVEAINELTIPGYSGLARCLHGSRDTQELQLRIYEGSIRIRRVDDNTVWRWDRKAKGWLQLSKEDE